MPAEKVRQDRLNQGFGEKIEDPEAIRRIAEILAMPSSAVEERIAS